MFLLRVKKMSRSGGQTARERPHLRLQDFVDAVTTHRNRMS